jgi:hypothetical protein
MDNVQRQWVTLGLMILFAAAIIASDVWLMKAHGVRATYSMVTADLLDRYPVALVVVVFGLGVLIGHILLPVSR